MANMSYCRFENTLRDLQECIDSLQNFDNLSESEDLAMRKMIDVAKNYVEIAEDIEDDSEDDSEYNGTDYPMSCLENI